MQFVDEVSIAVHAGDGGNGCVAFRRTRAQPLGGPCGGDGGNGGDVSFVATTRLTTLLDLRYRRILKAQRGEHGRGSDQHGAGGDDLLIPVPVGTQVFDAETGELLADLDTPEEPILIAKGGIGGRGNMRFTSSRNRAPRRADEGTPGESRKLRLELKLLADVGVVGYPNVGKSTLISAISKARPKIADYPFTTLTPNLGVVAVGDESFVMADIPGIIEGASEGAGLGIRFLKHIERTRALLHVISVDPDPEREPLADLERLEVELERFDEDLAKRPTLFAFSKLDLPEAKEAFEETKAKFAERGVTLYGFSSATHEGVDELLRAILASIPQFEEVPKFARPNPAARPHGDMKGFQQKPEDEDD